MEEAESTINLVAEDAFPGANAIGASVCIDDFGAELVALFFWPAEASEWHP